MQKNLNRIIFVFSILGLIISAFLTYEYLQPTPVVCPLTGNGCELVRKSEYSQILGISIPYIGIIYYFLTAIVSIYLSQNYKKIFDKLRLFAAFLSFMFGVYLTYLEAYVIKAYCFWCISSFVISIIILALALKSVLVKNSQITNEN